ncbi:MAG: VIT domain-containing protein, partial [Bacteroidota bacterium]
MIRTFLLFVFFFSISFVQSQNYLRVVDPDSWDAPLSSEPGWHEWLDHGAFDEVSIVATPQGIYTQIELFATISPGPTAWSWQGEFEIIWQFELPAKAIVHDSWLWVEEDIIKADVVDYWTALETYEGIVDRNEDPSFLYRLPDNRYEIRIYPLFAGDSRRVRMSFLIPTNWTTTDVTSDLLQQMLQGTNHPPATVSISTPVNDQWMTPRLRMDHQITPITELVVGGDGTMLNRIIVSGLDFVHADGASLVNDAPLSDDRSFLSTYSSEGEHFYQLAYLPDWEAVTEPEGENTLLLLDYDAFKSSLTKTQWIQHLQNSLAEHLGANDALNVALMTSNGIQFLSSDWINYDPVTFPNQLEDLLSAQNVNDLEQ